MKNFDPASLVVVLRTLSAVKFFNKPRPKKFRTSVLLATTVLATAACGGGGSDPAASSNAVEITELAKASAVPRTRTADTTSAVAATSLVPMLATPAYTVVTNEIIQDPKFDAGMQSWSLWDASSTFVSSELRPSGRALRIGSNVSQRLPVGKLEPGKSYTIVVKARTLKAGASQVAIVFREPFRNESFRTFKASVASTSYQNVQIDFTVPAHSGIVDLIFSAGGTPFMVDSTSLTMRAAIAQTEPVLSLTGSTVPPGYALAFNDEFNGTALDRNKWFTRYMYSNETLDRLNDEQQRYRDNDNHRVANGVLSLVAHKVGTTDPWGINYESGMVRSDWTALYGYYEARVKMPGGKGVWPAFWLAPDVAADGGTGWPPEIDIFEFVHDGLNEKLNMIHSNVHVASPAVTTTSYADAAWNEQWRFWTAPFNFNEGWHTVGVEWTPDTVTTYIDGKKIVVRSANWLRPDAQLGGPAHILLNLAIGGSWAGRNGIDDSAFPQALQIDWVRAYKKVN